VHALDEAHDLARRRAVLARQARAVDDPRVDPERPSSARTTSAPAGVLPPAP
jgi:hypothetical protein